MDEVTVTTKAPVTSEQPTFTYDEVRPIAGMLGLDVHSMPENDKQNIGAIYDFIRADNKEMTEADLLFKVRQLENRLGLPSLGERRVDKLYRYVKLQAQIDGLSKQRDLEFRR